MAGFDGVRRGWVRQLSCGWVRPGAAWHDLVRHGPAVLVGHGPVRWRTACRVLAVAVWFDGVGRGWGRQFRLGVAGMGPAWSDLVSHGPAVLVAQAVASCGEFWRGESCSGSFGGSRRGGVRRGQVRQLR